MTKKVPCAPLRRRISSACGVVAGLGPSSKVSATYIPDTGTRATRSPTGGSPGIGAGSGTAVSSEVGRTDGSGTVSPTGSGDISIGSTLSDSGIGSATGAAGGALGRTVGGACATPGSGCATGTTDELTTG